MTTFPAPSPVALDESAHGFISTFMTHVITLTGYTKNRLTTIASIKLLLLAALADGEPAHWRALYRAIDDFVDESMFAHDTRTAYAYLRSFIVENGDLAHD